MMKCIIVDDEMGAHHILEEYVARLDYAEITGKFTNAIEAFHFIKHVKVDVLLLDINMPQVSGFGLLEMLESKPLVIFTTAYSDYALKGFEYNAVDYLHKPIRFERFVIAMEKAQKWYGMQKTNTTAEYIELKVDGRLITIQTSNILYIESKGNYIKLYTQTDEVIVLMTMNEMEDKLPRNIFIRVHKSYIINVVKIREVENEKVLIANALLPIGKTYKKYFIEFLKSSSLKAYHNSA